MIVQELSRRQKWGVLFATSFYYNACMKLSAQEEYGIRCLLHMAGKGTGASLSIPEISRAEGLSIPNVAKLMRLLRIGGFVASVRGQAGGYTLTRPPDQISVKSVLELLGGRLFGANFCDRHSGLLAVCAHGENCGLRSLWSVLQRAVDNVLVNLTLSDLLKPESEMGDWLLSRPVQIEPMAKPADLVNPV
jgi:Rrf2 family protein